MWLLGRIKAFKMERKFIENSLEFNFPIHKPYIELRKGTRYFMEWKRKMQESINSLQIRF